MSSDFDPRTLWTRRQVAAAVGAGFAVAALPLGQAVACDAELAGRGGPVPLFVTDAATGGAPARRMAHLADAHLIEIAPGADMVRFWSARIAPNLRAGAAVMGLTSWADYVVLRGVAAEGRLRARFETGAGARVPVDDPALEALALKLQKAMEMAGDTVAANRMGWILA